MLLKDLKSAIRLCPATALKLKSAIASRCAIFRSVANIHAVELVPGAGAKFARSAGSYCQLLAREGEYVTLRMRSGEMRRVLANGRATIGEIGNSEHMLRQLGKAGANRWRGVRPYRSRYGNEPYRSPAWWW